MGRACKFKNPMNLAPDSLRKDETPTDRRELGIAGMTKGKTIKRCTNTDTCTCGGSHGEAAAAKDAKI